MTPQKLATYYQLAEMVVVPSRCYEGFGRIPQEAALFKKPVIITKSGGLPEQIIHGRTGLIVPKAKPQKLAQAILFLLENQKIRISLGKAHYEFTKKKFNPGKIVNKLINLYQQLL